MKNVSPVGVYGDSIDIFAVNVATGVMALVDDEAPASGVGGQSGEGSTDKAGPYNNIMIWLGVLHRCKINQKNDNCNIMMLK